MSKRERQILGALLILVLVMVIGISAMFYVTRIISEEQAYVEAARAAATQRQLERDLDRAMTPDG